MNDITVWLEYERENQLLSEWAVWVRHEQFIVGYGGGVLRPRVPGVTPLPDDLMLPVDRAVAATGPFHKRILVDWYLKETFDRPHLMRGALDRFRWEYCRFVEPVQYLT